MSRIPTITASSSLMERMPFITDPDKLRLLLSESIGELSVYQFFRNSEPGDNNDSSELMLFVTEGDHEGELTEAMDILRNGRNCTVANQGRLTHDELIDSLQ